MLLLRKSKCAISNDINPWTMPAQFFMDREIAMKIGRRGRRTPVHPLKPKPWADADVLARVRRLNVNALEAVVRTIASAAADDIEVVRRHKELWLAMDAAACSRIAGNPVSLMDLRFNDAEWWLWAANRAPKPIRARHAGDNLKIAEATTLTREILVEACITSRSRPLAAKLVFGLSSRVLELLADLPSPEIERIATAHHEELQLRWADDAVFWRNLLQTAISGSDEDIAAVHMHSLQLLKSE
jgi:hypothetical protein